MADQTIIVAELDSEGNFTGAARKASVSEEETIFQNWTTFGTWDAFKRALYAEDDAAEGAMISCPYCNVNYWSEDGHPSGTFCPVYGPK